MFSHATIRGRTSWLLHGLLTASVALASAAAPAQAQAHVLLGVDRLADSMPAVLVGKRVGLITNHTGRDRHGTSTIDILAKRSDLTLVALYAPEHGIRGVATGRVGDEVDQETGLPVHSLFGQTRKPTPEQLRGVDALVFDIQDVGVRQYTFLSTMALAMQAAAEKGIPFVVLDRPDPITGTLVEGNILDPAFSSFVGLYPIASRHGMTAGELAGFYNDHFGIHAELTVVRMTGWRRDLWMDGTDLPWKGPSPNLPNFEGTLHYPGTVFIEGTNLSEGRGTEKPFEQVGAPWLRAEEVADSMNALRLAGVRFDAVDYDIRPDARKYGGQRVHGVRLVATDRSSYRPIATTMLLIDMVRRLHPNDFAWTSSTGQDGQTTYSLDRLAGTDRLRHAIENGTLPALLAEWDRDAQRFRELRAPYLLYP